MWMDKIYPCRITKDYNAPSELTDKVSDFWGAVLNLFFVSLLTLLEFLSIVGPLVGDEKI